MINAIHMNRMNPSAFSSLTGDMMGLPETGEFDFMNYLLGLQVNPLENALDGDGNPLIIDSNSEKGVESDKVLLQVFGKKKQSGDPLLEGQMALASTVQTSTVSPIEIQPKDSGLVQDPSVPKQEVKAVLSKPISKKEDQNPLEDPLAKLAFDASVQDKDGKSILQNQFLQNRSDVKGKIEVETQEGLEVKKDRPEIQLESTKSLAKSDRTRKKDSDLLDAVIEDRSLRGSESVSDQKPIMQNQKIQHSHAPELFHKVESMALKGGGKMTLTLTPPELGQVEIEVTTKGRNVEVSVKSDNDFAKAAIEGQVADLQQSLQDQDLNLSKIEVHVSREMDPSFLENQFAGFSRQGNFHQYSQGSSQESYYRGSWDSAGDETPVRPVSMNNQISRTGNGRLDIRI